MSNETRALLKIYRQYPCRTLPNAFWKTDLDTPGSQLSLQRNPDGHLTSLAVWQKDHLMAFWCADPQVHSLTPEEVSQIPFALVHENGLSVFDLRRFTHRTPYFRIAHKGQPQTNFPPHGYRYKDFDPLKDIETGADLIQACYPNSAVDADSVRRWIENPVYHPDLWIWIIDEQHKKKAGLGIAEFDPNVPEVSLEWLQVHPRNQRKGLGKALVGELLRRSIGLAEIVTVSGQVNNLTQPERLYRSCGFHGSDVWWLLEE